jgi:predicted NBD/HSP70 family sugar kinase
VATPVPGTPSLLRAINDRAALELLLVHGSLTRPELGSLTGLSKPTASQLLFRLEQAGLVVLAGTREGATGRSAEVYRINPAAAHVAGLDVSPARIRAAVADLTGTVIGEHVLPTPGRSKVDAVARSRAAIEGAAHAAGIGPAALHKIVIGIQGAIDPTTGRLAYAAHLPGWHVPDLTGLLSAGLGRPVAIENDVNLAALAELDTGTATRVRDFVLLWVSDGIGMAVVLDRTLHRGAHGGAGEVAYMPLAGAPLGRGGRWAHTGGMQHLAGSPAILQLMRGHGFRGTSAVKAVGRAAAALEPAAASWPRPVGPAAEQATQRVTDGRARAAAALTELAGRLATALANVVAVVDPELIVLSGDVLLAGGEALRSHIERELLTMTVPRPRLRLSSVDGNPVLAGALHLALAATRDELFSSTVT